MCMFWRHARQSAEPQRKQPLRSAFEPHVARAMLYLSVDERKVLGGEDRRIPEPNRGSQVARKTT